MPEQQFDMGFSGLVFGPTETHRIIFGQSHNGSIQTAGVCALLIPLMSSDDSLPANLDEILGDSCL
jgi:hypothetical protein